MTSLKLPDPFYMTLVDFGSNLGVGFAGDPGDLDGACDAYAEHRAEGRPAVVYLLEPQEDGKLRVIWDATHGVKEHLAERYISRFREMPDWLEEDLA